MYPPAWRERYGAEFEALLEDTALRRSDVWDVLRGALIMRMTRVNVITIAAAFAVAGAIIAGVGTLARFRGYESSGTVTVQASGGSEFDAAVQLQQAVQRTLSRGSLAEIIQRPALDLYRAERTRLPLEDVVEQMRRNITVRMVEYKANRLTAAVAFRHPDPGIAKATTRALMDKLRSGLTAGAPVQFIEQGEPGAPVIGGRRWRVVGMGALVGLVAGLIAGGLWNLVRNRERWNLRRLAVCTVAGAAIGFGVGLRVPDTFVSTAVLRSSGELAPEVFNDARLSAVIRQAGMYAGMPEAEALREMRRNIRVTRTNTVGPMQIISFQDHDPVIAQHVTSALVQAWIETGLVKAVRSEVVDPASRPASASSPNRLTIVLMGTTAGVLLGLAAARMRRPASAIG
jgi:uncharacterized protein involved in exopolysaccharide biosynthesis